MTAVWLGRDSSHFHNLTVPDTNTLRMNDGNDTTRQPHD